MTKPMLTDTIGTEKQGLIQGRHITGDLMLVKKIIEHWAEMNTEAYVIVIDFKKECDKTARKTATKCMRAMNISEHLIELVELLWTESSAMITMDNEKKKDSEHKVERDKGAH